MLYTLIGAKLASSDRVSTASSSRESSHAREPPAQPTKLLDAFLPASLKRRRSNASMLNIATQAQTTVPNRAQTESPSLRPVTMQYGSINKSLPPTPRHPTHRPPDPQPPLMPLAMSQTAGSLRKSAVTALKKGKDLMKAKPRQDQPGMGALGYPDRMHDDDSSKASSLDLPITMPARRAESPFTAERTFPKGPGSESRSSSSLALRESSESKRSFSQPLEDRPAAVASHAQMIPRKSFELLRRMSETATVAPAGPRPLLPAQTVPAQAKVPEPRAMPRQPTTDQLLMLATAKLQALVNAAQAASASAGSSRESFPRDAAAPSTDRSEPESSASSPAPEEASTVLKEPPTSVASRNLADSVKLPELVPIQPRPLSPPVTVLPPLTDTVPIPPPPSTKITTTNLPRKSSISARTAPAASRVAAPLAAPPVPLNVPSRDALPPGSYWQRRTLAFETVGAAGTALPQSWLVIENALLE